MRPSSPVDQNETVTAQPPPRTRSTAGLRIKSGLRAGAEKPKEQYLTYELKNVLIS